MGICRNMGICKDEFQKLKHLKRGWIFLGIYQNIFRCILTINKLARKTKILQPENLQMQNV